jgi:hypothetical protein
MPDVGRDVATLDATAYFTVAGGIDFARRCAEFAAFVNADDDAVDSAAGCIAGSRKIFHRVSAALFFLARGCRGQNKTGSLTVSAARSHG